MSRPVYEQESDVSNQAGVASCIEDRFGVLLYPLPQFAVVDFVFCSSVDKMALVEIKCRPNLSTRYPTLILSKQKSDKAASIAALMKIKFMVVARWDDGIFFRYVTPDDLKHTPVERGGRTDRGDPKDIEDVYHLLVASFERL